ncbi:hypothetical protein E6W39_09185 [Kitasatospora acidiphila]|uniref:Butirosin biosynthesis protein H N-terminal domain-containing protein n=1 Tax=Kitasatospora acidiphila TaxID=2567942 RepID=A0A540W087_9ACTN|nr:hypothetical protein [Kitasatospora acidiphila]TQF02410.1 hypothetical protein E6W39_09185 [Kitasatospora acidiphila]
MESEILESEILERYDDVAVNCLTGCYSALAGMLGRPVPEQAVFERGGGYLFQAGLDEAGYPEYIFPVEEVGSLGMTRSGFGMHKEPIDFTDPGRQLADLLARFRGVVVWVNTAHLRYAEVYRDNAPYLHAVLIEDIAADRSHVTLLDTLVVGANPFACRARLTLTDLVGAAGDRIKSDAHDGMGYFYAAADEGPRPAGQVPGAEPGSAPRSQSHGGPGAGSGPGQLELGSQLADQAERFFAEERFHGAIRRYQELCEACFADGPERAAVGARRLFHHANVLYAVPSLALMGRSLQVAGARAGSLALHEEAVRHWHAMGVLALRFEATGAASVLSRITQRFAQLDDVTGRLWESLRRA